MCGRPSSCRGCWCLGRLPSRHRRSRPCRTDRHHDSRATGKFPCACRHRNRESGIDLACIGHWWIVYQADRSLGTCVSKGINRMRRRNNTLCDFIGSSLATLPTIGCITSDSGRKVVTFLLGVFLVLCRYAGSRCKTVVCFLIDLVNCPYLGHIQYMSMSLILVSVHLETWPSVSYLDLPCYHPNNENSQTCAFGRKYRHRRMRSTGCCPR